jgi:hypothetical protein
MYSCDIQTNGLQMRCRGLVLILGEAQVLFLKSVAESWEREIAIFFDNLSRSLN